MIDGQRSLIDACIAEGVARYMPSDFSFDFRGLELGDFPFKDFQWKTVEYVDSRDEEGGLRLCMCLTGRLWRLCCRR